MGRVAGLSVVLLAVVAACAPPVAPGPEPEPDTSLYCQQYPAQRADWDPFVVCGVEFMDQEFVDAKLEELQADVLACLQEPAFEALNLAPVDSVYGYRMAFADEIIRVPSKFPAGNYLIGYADLVRRIVYVRYHIPFGTTHDQVARHEVIHVVLRVSHKKGDNELYDSCEVYRVK